MQFGKFVLERHLPILGICRGLQILIVAYGGTLIPHIPDVYDTSALYRLEPGPGRRLPTEHLVRIDVESLLADCLQNSRISVVSWHHQAVEKVPPGWRVVAHAWDDGVIEAVEHEHHPWAIGVQWHPELSILDPNHQRVFLALVQAAHTIHFWDDPNLATGSEPG
ncbi:MAG: gamma-glutamyl-gamma-aminobutyrate hydrolase family protein [Nostoc sp. ChiQUE02]|uniref:gamma-glutamyl-gamma-aminobutyrate hydrolase family protein n=1 Tax=Nostoc sp. ChiQUE02 TaxID=3075377 RepID=UPI002AD48578|nr:gamma-glutamyl-gamma-aminobutyrate hydrolase family protein [Nostoc sp. ChiQUE02]MDZ8233357.1 gamma-glutamyl-gamma-aminobutyrate hydrolase family protein [Nostoc sp. ChiQUE02]